MVLRKADKAILIGSIALIILLPSAVLFMASNDDTASLSDNPLITLNNTTQGGNGNTTISNQTDSNNGNNDENITVVSMKSGGLVIPMYTSDPTEDWDRLYVYQKQYPNMDFYVVVNRNSGPGDFNTAFDKGIEKMQSANITVLGYVWTDYGRLDESKVKSDIELWGTQYGVDGIFLSGMSYPGCGCPGTPEYYKELSSYADELGMPITVGDAGALVGMSDYLDSVDVINIYVNQGLPDENEIAEKTSSASPSKWSIVPYGVSSIEQSYFDAIRSSVGFVYVTDETGPNPWAKLPSYFETLLEYI
jgi:hypothetical protein